MSQPEDCLSAVRPIDLPEIVELFLLSSYLYMYLVQLFFLSLHFYPLVFLQKFGTVVGVIILGL